MPPGFAPGGFDCGEPDLTQYLHDGDAARDEQVGFSRTYLLIHEDECVGYFTVLADAIRLQSNERPDDVNYPTAPALKLGRMGVHNNFQHRGVGYWILDFVVGMARDMSEHAGVRYVTLDALNEELVGWYTGYGFVLNHGEAEGRIAWLKHIGRWVKGGKLHRTSLRFDIILEEEVGNR